MRKKIHFCSLGTTSLHIVQQEFAPMMSEFLPIMSVLLQGSNMVNLYKTIDNDEPDSTNYNLLYIFLPLHKDPGNLRFSVYDTRSVYSTLHTIEESDTSTLREEHHECDQADSMPLQQCGFQSTLREQVDLLAVHPRCSYRVE